jgi:hypothetical protein
MSSLQTMIDNNPMLNFRNEADFIAYFSDLIDRLKDFWNNQNSEFNRTDDDIGNWVNDHKKSWRLPTNINSYYRRIIHKMVDESDLYSDSHDVDDGEDKKSRQITLFNVPKE